METAAVNASILALMMFSGCLLVVALFLAGVHITPDPEKSAASVSVISKAGGYGELIGAIILLIFSPIGPAPSLFLGTLVGFFAFLFLIAGWIIEKGGDLKPLGTYLLFVGVALVIYGYFASMVPGMGELAALLFLTGAGAFLSCIGAWGLSEKLGKIGGWVLVIVAIWGIRFWALELYEGAIKVMLGG